MEWISVNDHLPDVGKLVLVCNPRSIPTTYGFFLGEPHRKWMINDEPETSLLKTDVVSFVTHWMPLPQPPPTSDGGK